MSKNIAPKTNPLSTNPDSLVHELNSVYKRASDVFNLGRQSVLNIVGFVQLQLMGSPNSKASEIGQEIINQLQPIADAIDALNSLQPSLSQARDTSLELRDEVTNLTDTLSAVQLKFSQQPVRIPRPDSCFLLEGDVPQAFQNMPVPKFDVFHAVNSEASVLSRIRFLLSSQGGAVGIAVIASEEDVHGPQLRNMFEFDRFISFASQTIGRDLDINNNVGDRIFLYRTVVDLAVKLADAEVSSAGALGTIIPDGGQASDVSTNADDTLSEALQQLDDGVDSQFPQDEDLEAGQGSETEPQVLGQLETSDETAQGGAELQTSADDLRELEDLFGADDQGPDVGPLQADPDSGEEVELTEDDAPVQLVDLDAPGALLAGESPVFEIDPDLATDDLDQQLQPTPTAADLAENEVGERVSLDGGDMEVEDLVQGQGSPFSRFQD